MHGSIPRDKREGTLWTGPFPTDVLTLDLLSWSIGEKASSAQLPPRSHVTLNEPAFPSDPGDLLAVLAIADHMRRIPWEADTIAREFLPGPRKGGWSNRSRMVFASEKWARRLETTASLSCGHSCAIDEIRNAIQRLRIRMWGRSTTTISLDPTAGPVPKLFTEAMSGLAKSGFH